MKFKRRPLAWTALFFSLGITAAYYFSGFPYLFLALLVFILLFIVVNFNCNHFCKYFAVIMLIVFLIGFGRTYWQGVKYKSRNSIAYWNGEDSSLVTGRIQEDLSTLEGDKVYLKPYNINSHRVKYGLIQLDRRYLPRQVSEGEIVSLRLGLEQPAVKKNPGGFSYYKYLKKRGIFSIGYYQGGLKKLGTRPRFLRQIICSAKKKFLYLINQNINEPYSEIIKALVLGERENIPSEWEKNFTRAGANHLLAISGLHVGFIMLIFIGLMQITGLPEGVGNLICSLLLAGYILISGARVSVIRAGLITILFMWAPFFNRKADLFNIAGMTVIIILLLNPLYLFTVGFQLTYLVLFMIILWAGLLKDYYIPGLLNVSLAAQLGSLPIIAYYFNLATPAGLITNIWAIPLAALVVLTAITGLLLGLIHPVFLQTAGFW